jgi:acyl-CoA thioester hydrolase
MTDLMTSPHPLLQRFPVCIELSLQWGEMDSYGHLNNVVNFRYFESARMAYFRAIGFFENTGVGPILHSTSCRYRMPLHHPDKVWVGTRVTSVLADRFLMEMAIVSQHKQQLAATGEATIVAFDYVAQGKSLLPANVAQSIQVLEEKAQKSLP